MIRVLHSPVNIGNQPWILSRNERELGIKSDLIINYSTWPGYAADEVISLYGEINFTNLFNRIYSGLSAPFKYDVLHYYFGRSLFCWDDWPKIRGLPFLDLRIAKFLGKTIIFTLQGCDVRIAEKSNKNNRITTCSPSACSAYKTCISYLDSKREQLIQEILPLCDRYFYLNPELGHFLPGGDFLPYANVDIRQIKPDGPTGNSRPKIVHAPSDPAIKGSSLIIAALDRLQDKYDFELILVQNKSHSEAMKIYRSADILIDQVLAGWYGGLSVELMAMGKPVMCYIREEDLMFVPKQLALDLPFIKIHPDSLEKDISMALDNWLSWEKFGQKSRIFVERWHDPLKIAQAMLKIYKNPVTSVLEI